MFKIRDLDVTFRLRDDRFVAVSGLNLGVASGEVVGVIGESGSGKSTAFMGALGLLPDSAEVTGEVWFRDEQLGALDKEARRRLLASEIGVIFQDPTTSLDPLFKIGAQMREVLRASGPSSRAASRARAAEMLTSCGVSDAERRLDQYPFQLSGGLNQRVSIAMAFAHSPSLIVADEPTTALDVTIQSQILRLLLDLVRRRGSGLVLISHNLAVVFGIADRVVVMYGGVVVEEGATRDVFENPSHPYTQRLLASAPKPGGELRDLVAIPGRVPSRYDKISGCRFAPRCERAMQECEASFPSMRLVADGHMARCVLARGVDIATAQVEPETGGV